MHDGDEDAVLAALEEALAAHLVVEVGETTVTRALRSAMRSCARRSTTGSAPRAGTVCTRAPHGPSRRPRRGLARRAGDARAARRPGRRPRPRDRVLAARGRPGARAVGLGGRRGALGRRAGGHGARRRPARQRARLLVALGELMVVAGDPGRHIGYLERALALYEDAGRRRARGPAPLPPGHGLCADRLDLRRAPRHRPRASGTSTPRAPRSTRGPVRKALGHLENGVGIALMYAARHPGRARGRRPRHGDRRAAGRRRLWAAAAITYGWHVVQAGRLAEGFDDRRAGVHRRRPRAAPVRGLDGLEHARQLAWGLGAPDEAQAFFERPLRLPYIGETAFRHEMADGDRALPPDAR